MCLLDKHCTVVCTTSSYLGRDCFIFSCGDVTVKSESTAHARFHASEGFALLDDIMLCLRKS